MNDSTAPISYPASAETNPSVLDRAARRAVHHLLAHITDARIEVIENGERLSFGDPAAAPITVRAYAPAAYSRILFGGTVGAGEAWMDGLWDCDDLTALLRVFLRDRSLRERMDGPLTRAKRGVDRAVHWLNRNTPLGSRRNISAHYDLGNDFFEAFLDPTLCYSCGVYESPDATLEQASVAKMDRLCRKLDLTPRDHLLEIGTGWGGLALHAAQNYGCRVTTTTISREQHEVARDRIERAGLSDRVTLHLKDYRHLSGRFDKLVSVEMIEAVGSEFLATYFRKCSDLLRPGGMMALQSITVADQAFDRYRRSVDFINRYIFPGGCLPSVTAICTTLTKATDLRVFHLEEIGPHYARTLREWRRRFRANLTRIEQMGYPVRFQRMWEYYLSSCEAGFEERTIGDVQMILTKPDCRRAPLVPSLRNS